VIRPLLHSDLEEYARMRTALWPRCDRADTEEEMYKVLGTAAKYSVFVSVRPGGGLQGFLEASLRDYADDCTTSPVGYIEGWYVDPDARRKGVGRQLVAAAEEWARSKGCQEMASDTELTNTQSQAVHRRLGYDQCDTLVHFRKVLRPR
jgi:aminoglycoside 6'-N-acetyltransferase I